MRIAEPAPNNLTKPQYFIKLQSKFEVHAAKPIDRERKKLMSDQPIRVGIVGAGANTTLRHIPGLQAMAGVEIVSVCNRSRASSERVAQEYGIATVYDDWLQLINAADTNAIVIGTWPYLHCRATLAALAADKHVMVEARMAATAQEAHLMADAARMNPHLVSQIVPPPHPMRYKKTLKRLINENYLGDVLAIEVRGCGNTFLDPAAPLHWRNDFDLSGFNIMYLGIFYEIIMDWVGEATNVMAMGQTFVKMRTDSAGKRRPVRIPEHLDVVAEMACGAQAHIQLSAVSGLGAANEFYLFGSEGTLKGSLDLSNPALWGGRKGDKALQEIEIPAGEIGSWRVEEEFVNAIRGQEVIEYTNFEVGLKYMEFTEAVTRSMQEGRLVPLPL
jgi:predicted dehydrogenase